MKSTGFIKLLSFILLFLLTGCGRNNEETVYDKETTSETSESSEIDSTAMLEPEELLDAFLANEIPAFYDDKEESAIIFDQLAAEVYSVGERIDLDNDGENEQIVDGPYGGIYFDARDGKVYVLASGEGTTGILFYTNYANAVWIVHSDTTHAGRQMYWLTRYDGEGNIVDEFQLSAEYWDSPDGKYDENSDFTYRDEKVSMEEYEALKKEILGGHISTEEDGNMDDSASAVSEIPTEENGIMEIYADGDKISVSEDMMTAQVSPQEILTGNPVIYDRFRVDGWVFEWLISDYNKDDNWFYEDGVLVVSHENDAEDVQIIHVEAEGGYAFWVSAEDKFEYVDVNFDSIPDLLICTGHHGNQGLLTYYCFLQTENGFAESPTFTDIPNPSVDAEHQLILSQWRNSATSHSWAEYICQDNTYVKYRELCEECVDFEKDIWRWTVNGKEIGRSDEFSMEEIENLLYNETSEWRIAEDRWRTLYNDGLMIDYSIYGEP